MLIGYRVRLLWSAKQRWMMRLMRLISLIRKHINVNELNASEHYEMPFYTNLVTLSNASLCTKTPKQMIARIGMPSLHCFSTITKSEINWREIEGAFMLRATQQIPLKSIQYPIWFQFCRTKNNENIKTVLITKIVFWQRNTIVDWLMCIGDADDAFGGLGWQEILHMADIDWTEDEIIRSSLHHSHFGHQVSESTRGNCYFVDIWKHRKKTVLCAS